MRFSLGSFYYGEMHSSKFNRQSNSFVGIEQGSIALDIKRTAVVSAFQDFVNNTTRLRL